MAQQALNKITLKLPIKPQ